MTSNCDQIGRIGNELNGQSIEEFLGQVGLNNIQFEMI
jgi:hypothetical protein